MRPSLLLLSFTLIPVLFTTFMDSDSSASPAQFKGGDRWASLLGTAIAISTLIIPTATIAYFSALSSRETVPRYATPTAERVSVQTP